jgi:hypothetical protein
VRDLDVFIDLFFRPIKAAQAGGQLKLSEQDFREVFSNIDVIATLHQLLLVDWERAVATSASSGGARLAEAFCGHAPMLKHSYAQYVAAFARSSEQLEALPQRDRKLAALLESAQRDERARGLDAGAFLIMPIQRLPRYEMLFSELRKASQPGDPAVDAASLTALDEALASVRQLTVHVNEQRRRTDSMAKLAEVQRQLPRNRSAIALAPGRELRLEAALRVKSSLSRESDRFKEQRVTLFSDALLWQSMDDRVKGLLAVTGVHTANPEGPDEHVLLVLGTDRVSGQPVELALSFASAVLLEQWRAGIADAVGK